MPLEQFLALDPKKYKVSDMMSISYQQSLRKKSQIYFWIHANFPQDSNINEVTRNCNQTFVFSCPVFVDSIEKLTLKREKNLSREKHSLILDFSVIFSRRNEREKPVEKSSDEFS